MTGRGPCSAMRLSICERNYASPFGFAKTRYRGLRKTANALTVLFAFANVAMWSRAGRPELPAESPA